MADNSKAWVGSLVGGLGLILAMQWEQFLKAMQLVPDTVTSWVEKLPTETFGTALAFMVACAAWGMSFAHPAILTKKPQSGADVSAVLAALLASMSMCWAFGESSPKSVLSFFWLGFVAGCVGAFISRQLWSKAAPPKDAP